jgi:hypothetical protein
MIVLGFFFFSVGLLAVYYYLKADLNQCWGSVLASVRIRIRMQHFTSNWIRIQGAMPMRIQTCTDFAVTKS